tara:strand:- start:1010 stop:1339 length:330 start_codon:yes stop_codon:yes gene_type:complete
MKTFKEFICERGPSSDYSDDRNVRPPVKDMDDHDAREWADALVMVHQNTSENKRQQVESLWQSIQAELDFDRIEELIFMHLQNHERKNAAAAVLSIIRPDQGGAAVYSQ